MKEFAKDDNERDEDEEETNTDSSARPQLATTRKHIRIREEADKLYLRNAERMRMKYTKCKRKKVLTFSPGDIVSIRIPRIDRTSTDFHRIPCVMVERRGSKFFLYRLRYMYMQTLFYFIWLLHFNCICYNLYRCAHGVLKVCYGEGDLEPFQGGVNLTVEGWEKDKIYH